MIFLLLSLTANGQDAVDEGACIVPPGPPCISWRDPRLTTPGCYIAEGACFSFLWNEYQQALVTKAQIRLVPKCGSEDESTAELTKKAADYFESVQSTPVETETVLLPCATEGYLDIILLESSDDKPPSP